MMDLTWLYVLVAVFVAVVILPYVYNLLLGENAKFDPKGKHCYVTGGSAGLGLHTAIQLAKKGANVTIVARRVKVLEVALKQIEAAKVSPDQKFCYVSSDLSTNEGCVSALDQAKSKMLDQTPEYIFCCAGASQPKLFVDHDPTDFEWTMKANYFSAVYTSHHAVKMMIKEKIKGGKIVFVSSTLAFLNFIGYNSYSPTKAALRNLAEGLRNELIMYDIGVHIYFPANLDSPGFVEENKTKPAITAKIEGEDPPLAPSKAATYMLNGIAKNQFAITSDFITDVFRCLTKGATPTHHFGFDWIITNLGYLLIPIVRMFTEGMVRKEAAILAKKK
ncbi:hypothetical protein BKA69DRAFT_486465 [Paraphysoderma sedebokerense]|nr:hypothetical protein BKA69DRAFT_486465 [Paraphysoderma sedebokerense]